MKQEKPTEFLAHQQIFSNLIKITRKATRKVTTMFIVWNSALSNSFLLAVYSYCSTEELIQSFNRPARFDLHVLVEQRINSEV